MQRKVASRAVCRGKLSCHILSYFQTAPIIQFGNLLHRQDPSAATRPMSSPFYHLRCLPAPTFKSITTISTTPTRSPTTLVAILWDLAASRPPSTLPLYDAAIRLRLVATSFGCLHLSAAFLHPSHHRHLTSTTPTTTAHLCRICGRRFSARDVLLRHFDAIHSREHAKRLARIDSSRGTRRARLAAALSLKLAKYDKAARELIAASVPASPADDLRRAGVHVELSQAPSTSLLEHAQEVLNEGSVRCLLLVSGHKGLDSVLRLARERGVRSVVVGEEGGLARWADVGFSWVDVIAGKARKAAPSTSGKWRDRDMLKRLEWSYEGDDEEMVFEEDSDGDGLEEMVTKVKGRPWWKLESDAEDSRVGG